MTLAKFRNFRRRTEVFKSTWLSQGLLFKLGISLGLVVHLGINGLCNFVQEFESHVGSKTTIRLVNRKHFAFRESEREIVMQHVTTLEVMKEYVKFRQQDPQSRTYPFDMSFYEQVPWDATFTCNEQRAFIAQSSKKTDIFAYMYSVFALDTVDIVLLSLGHFHTNCFWCKFWVFSVCARGQICLCIVSLGLLVARESR